MPLRASHVNNYESLRINVLDAIISLSTSVAPDRYFLPFLIVTVRAAESPAAFAATICTV